MEVFNDFNGHNPFKCKEHDQRWHLISQLGADLCVKCCQYLFVSSGSNSTLKELLNHLDSCLRYGPQLSKTLSDSQTMSSGETYLFIESIAGLLYDSDIKTRLLSKNCLNLIISQINEQSINEYLFEDIFKNISDKNLVYNESTLELMAEVMEDICLERFHLKDEIDILFKRLQFEFIKLEDNRLKTSVLTLFNAFYKNYENNELFCLENDFHLNTLSMVYNIFDSLNNYSNDRQLILNSINLVKSLSKFDSILQSLTTNQQLIPYLTKLLSDKCLEIKDFILDWICDILYDETNSNQHIRLSLSSTLYKQMMDLFIEELQKSPNISKRLLESIYLILENIPKSMAETKLSSLLKTVIKCLQNSMKSKDNNHFVLAINVLRKISERNTETNIQLINEFDFHLIIDLCEISLSTYELFEVILVFCVKFFEIKNVPVLIPTKRMMNFFTKVSENISNTDNDFTFQCIERTKSAVTLIKSFLCLINEKKNNDLEDKTQDRAEYTHFLNAENSESQWNHNISDLEDFNENNNIKNFVSKQTEIYKFLSFCLKQLKPIFAKVLQRFETESYFKNNLQLLEEICFCFKIVIENNLFDIEDTHQFIKELFAKGYVLSVLKLWFCKYPSNECLSSLLSLLLNKIQIFEKTNKIFDKNVIQKQLIESKDKYSNLCIDFAEEVKDENNRESVNTFLAINYYCLKFLIKYDYYKRIEDKYKDIFISVLNVYLQNNLSSDFECVSSVKYSLFLSSVSNIDYKSMEALNQFFGNKGNEQLFYSKYYTNHIQLIQWLFSDLKCDKFSEFAVKKFLKEIPETHLNSDEKQTISSFFTIICENEKAIEILIKALCDTNEDNSTLNVILNIIENSEQFYDNSFLCNSWHSFYEELSKNISKITLKLVKNIKSLINSNDILWESQDMEISQIVSQNVSENVNSIVNPDLIDKISKVLKFLSHLLSNYIPPHNYESFEDPLNIVIFDTLLDNLCKLIDKHLDDSTLQIIFEFFRLCLNSFENSDKIEEILTKYLLGSKVGVPLLFNCLNTEDKQQEGEEEEEEEEEEEISKMTVTALFLLSILSKQKHRKKLNHNFVYNLDINRLMNFLNSESKVMTESAFLLLIICFETNSYFESKEKIEEIKVEEMRKLIHCLQNAVFREYISLSEITLFLYHFFTELEQKSPELMKDLANSRWFRVIVDHYLETDQLIDGLNENDSNEEQERKLRILSEEFVEFLLLFLKMVFVNTSLIPIINEMTELFINIVDKPEDKTFDLIPKHKAFEVLELIDGSEYASHLTQQNRILLTKVSEIVRNSCCVEHNYCFTPEM